MSQQGKGKTNSHIEIDSSVLKETGRIVSRNNTRYPTGKNASKMPDSNPFAVKQPTKAQSQTLYGNPLRPAVNNFISEPNHPQLGGKAESSLLNGTVSSWSKTRGQVKQNDKTVKKVVQNHKTKVVNQVGQNDFIEGLTLDKLMFNKQSSDKELEETIEYFSSSDNMSQLNNKDIMRKHLERVADFFRDESWKKNSHAKTMVELHDDKPFSNAKIQIKSKREHSTLIDDLRDIPRKIQEYKVAEGKQSSRVATRPTPFNQGRPVNTALVDSQRIKVTKLELERKKQAVAPRVYETPAQSINKLKSIESDIAYEKQQLLMLESQKKATADAKEVAEKEVAEKIVAAQAAEAKAEAEKAKEAEAKAAEKEEEERKRLAAEKDAVVAEQQVTVEEAAADKAAAEKDAVVAEQQVTVEEVKQEAEEFNASDSIIQESTDADSIDTSSNEDVNSSFTFSPDDTDEISREEVKQINQEIVAEKIVAVEGQPVEEVKTEVEEKLAEHKLAEQKQVVEVGNEEATKKKQLIMKI